MSTDKQYDKELGLDMSMEEALVRFATVTKEELAEAAENGVPAIKDGEMELVPFKKEAIRRVFHNEEWWYSIVDVVSALTGTERGRKYWSDLKTKMVEKEGFFELSDEIGQLPMPSQDGKLRQTDVATTETLFRIIQSIQSPKVEPLKRWLARVGYERIQEAQDPEILIKRAILHYQVRPRALSSPLIQSSGGGVVWLSRYSSTSFWICFWRARASACFRFFCSSSIGTGVSESRRFSSVAIFCAASSGDAPSSLRL